MNFPGTILKQGDTGPAVTAIQQALGLGPGGQTGTFGPYTEELVCKFQKGAGIQVNGTVGPQTWGALFAPRPTGNPDVGQAALKIALSQVGVREVPLGSNRGPQVDRWLTDAGAHPGEFWCMAFVYGQILQACQDLRRDIRPVFPRTASCSFAYNWARTAGRLTARPEPGDVFLCRGGERGHYHTGFVVTAPDDTSRFQTCEGNSNDNGSANGIGVFHLSPGRRVDSCDYIKV